MRESSYPDGLCGMFDGQSTEEAGVLLSLHLTPADHVSTITLLILTRTQQLLIVKTMILTFTNTSVSGKVFREQQNHISENSPQLLNALLKVCSVSKKTFQQLLLPQ